MRKDKINTNPTVANRENRLLLSCPICRPNRGENKKPCGKHGKGKPKYKSRRKGKA